jgi:hypothetical protein
MNRYLLLRDNKQSGPYTVPELIEKGIKAYDLVWLDGKSAAWRYPSEIEELKAYAPIVEEQPFDRFYKKPAAEKHFAETAMTSRNEFMQMEASARDAVNGSQERYQAPQTEVRVLNADIAAFERAHVAAAKTSEDNVTAPPEPKSVEAVPLNVLPPHDGPRKIYVTLPGSKSVTRINSETAKPASLASQSEKLTERPAPAAPDTYRDEQVLYGKSESNQNERFSPTPKYKKIESDYKKTELADSSFSSKFAGADLLTDTVFPGRSKRSLLAGNQNAAIMIMGAVCLLLGGIIIGLAISNSKKESAKELNNLVRQIQEREKLKQLPASQPVARTEEPVIQVMQTAQPGSEEQVVVQKPKTNSGSRGKLALSRNVADPDKKPEAPPVQTVSTDAQPINVQPAVQENKNLSDAAMESARKNIRQLISVQSNKYKTGVLGGISDLSLTVSNKSDFEIDQVEVEVAYLGPEKRVIKTQTIVFNNIKAGNHVTLEVPRTNRGVSVTTSIKVINSKSLGLAKTGT